MGEAEVILEHGDKLILDLIDSQVLKIGGPGDLGRWLIMKPENQNIIIDYTTPIGGCSGLYWSLVFWLPKQDYKLKKVDETLDVSPVHADVYNLLVGQRERIEGHIKTGLASAAQAVTDYELIAHDYRRYSEVWEYFKKGKKDSHVLRSLFVDRVDAYTGEGFSLISMAKRWPTIITDFIRMGSEEFKGKEWKTVEEIKEALDVPKAEATVLKTKNELFVKWKDMFLPELKSRLARIEAIMKARKASVEQYRKWLRPYVSRHKMMSDSLERSTSANFSNPYMPPAFGQATMFTTIRIWAWKPFPKLEPHKPDSYRDNKRREIEPYDELVREYKEVIEEKYGVEISDDEVKSIINSELSWTGPHGERNVQMDDRYYILFDFNIQRSVIRTPGGGEIEDMMFNKLTTWIFSQNALLILLLELRAREKKFEREIDELIGISDESKDIKKLEEEFEKEGKEKVPEKKRLKEAIPDFLNSAGRRIRSVFRPFSKYFLRPGPYENDFKERITKVFLVTSGGIFGEVTGFIKDAMGVGKASAEVYE